MNVLDAAFEVLSNAREPLSLDEITKRMLSSGLWETSGKTPAATVGARIAVHIKENDMASRFHRVRPGVFAVGSKPISRSSDFKSII